ncbi:cullin-4A [Trichonephila clavipes]|uniref:Cullin-4A n=1 Tax=Trichonephila clavipes TaxID=2585209 RepID=A0A8X6VK65_TRICX|nr:cullin-4A [Trichonephila clavipes]
MRGHGSLVVKVSDRDCRVTSSSRVPLKTRHIRERCTLNLSRAQMPSGWCGVVVRRGVRANSEDNPVKEGPLQNCVVLCLGLNLGEDMNVCKCILPSRHEGTLNSRRTASPLVRFVEGEERWETPDLPLGVLPQNWRETKLNRSVTCMVFKATANDRRHLALCHDEFRGP